MNLDEIKFKNKYFKYKKKYLFLKKNIDIKGGMFAKKIVKINKETIKSKLKIKNEIITNTFDILSLYQSIIDEISMITIAEAKLEGTISDSSLIGLKINKKEFKYNELIRFVCIIKNVISEKDINNFGQIKTDFKLEEQSGGIFGSSPKKTSLTKRIVLSMIPLVSGIYGSKTNLSRLIDHASIIYNKIKDLKMKNIKLKKSLIDFYTKYTNEIDSKESEDYIKEHKNDTLTEITTKPLTQEEKAKEIRSKKNRKCEELKILLKKYNTEYGRMNKIKDDIEKKKLEKIEAIEKYKLYIEYTTHINKYIEYIKQIRSLYSDYWTYIKPTVSEEEQFRKLHSVSTLSSNQTTSSISSHPVFSSSSPMFSPFISSFFSGGAAFTSAANTSGVANTSGDDVEYNRIEIMKQNLQFSYKPEIITKYNSLNYDIIKQNFNEIYNEIYKIKSYDYTSCKKIYSDIERFIYNIDMLKTEFLTKKSEYININKSKSESVYDIINYIDSINDLFTFYLAIKKYYSNKVDLYQKYIDSINIDINDIVDENINIGENCNKLNKITEYNGIELEITRIDVFIETINSKILRMIDYNKKIENIKKIDLEKKPRLDDAKNVEEFFKITMNLIENINDQSGKYFDSIVNSLTNRTIINENDNGDIIYIKNHYNNIKILNFYIKTMIQKINNFHENRKKSNFDDIIKIDNIDLVKWFDIIIKINDKYNNTRVNLIKTNTNNLPITITI